MLYRVQQHKDNISQLEDTKLRSDFAKIKQLSNNFTSKNAKAMELDDIIFPIVHYQLTKEIITSEQEIKSIEALKQQFSKVLTNLAQISGGSGDVNIEQVEAIIEKSFKTKKIGIDNLSDDLKKKIGDVQKIKFIVPDTETPEVTDNGIDEFQEIIDQLMLGHNLFFVGGAGTGKTTLAQNIADTLGREYITINCSQWTAPTEIIGGQTLDGYQEGKMIEAWEKGYVLILDELPKLDPNTAGLLNDALAKSKQSEAVIFNSRKEKFKKHKNFSVIATGNIYPNAEDMAYGANNKQDLSLLDRFSGSVYWIEKNPKLEKMIVQNDLIWKIADKIRTVIEEMKYEAQMSLRWMIGARDVFQLEKDRKSGKRKDNVEAKKGITLQKYLDSYLSTFSENQREIIKEKIDYQTFILEYKAELID